MKNFLEDLKKELSKRNIAKDAIDDILKDHEDMIKEALEDGLSEEDLEKRFGTPENIAESLATEEETVEQEKEKNIDKDQSFEFECKQSEMSIQVELTNEDIYIKPTEYKNVLVNIENADDLKDYIVEFNDQTLSITRKKQNKMFSFFSTKAKNTKIYIGIPAEVLIKSLISKQTNGDVVLKKLNTKHISLNLVNGDIDIKEVVAEGLKFHIVNGDIELQKIKASTLYSSQVSGDLEIKNSLIDGNLEVKTVSGDIELEEVTCDMFEADSVSGDIDGKEFYPKMIRFKSLSGDLNIKNKEKKEIKIIKKSTLSGDINVDI
ncbi:hypothetical protein BK011_05900 [Tenericutes bacterium MZ-XQ]|jgi:DUF4097 and DUF4098 domain-containing protein YvlB|nr:hypothetical protein BK011_05900 [Tenericutes bacterium MZ-XQ]